MKKITIVGGFGYMGTELVSRYLKDAKDIRLQIIDLDLWNGEIQLKKIHSLKNVDIEKCDINNFAKLNQTIERFRPNTIFWLAGLVGAPVCKKYFSIANYTNIISIKNYINLSLERNHKQFLEKFFFISSCSVYGNTSGVMDIATEKSATSPLSEYAEMKLDVEEFLLNHDFSKKISVCIPRITTLFGLSIKPRYDLFLNSFCLQAGRKKKIIVNGGNQLRSMIHVKDVASALFYLETADKKNINGEIFHIGVDKFNLTVLNLAQIVSEIAKIEVEVIKKIDDQRSYKISSKKLFDTIGWINEIQLEEGIKELITYSSRIRNEDNQDYFNANFNYEKLYN
jgi:nucleoside-diphosphate-sugar epimerase